MVPLSMNSLSLSLLPAGPHFGVGVLFGTVKIVVHSLKTPRSACAFTEEKLGNISITICPNVLFVRDAGVFLNAINRPTRRGFQI